MASDCLYVSNLPFRLTDESLANAFAGCCKARVIIDPNTGRSRGFGFVTFDTPESAKEAHDSMNGEVEIEGRTCSVNYARPREPREQRQPRFDGGDRRGHDSYGGRGGGQGSYGGRGGNGGSYNRNNSAPYGSGYRRSNNGGGSRGFHDDSRDAY